MEMFLQLHYSKGIGLTLGLTHLKHYNESARRLYVIKNDTQAHCF